MYSPSSEFPVLGLRKRLRYNVGIANTILLEISGIELFLAKNSFFLFFIFSFVIFLYLNF